MMSVLNVCRCLCTRHRRRLRRGTDAQLQVPVMGRADMCLVPRQIMDTCTPPVKPIGIPGKTPRPHSLYEVGSSSLRRTEGLDPRRRWAHETPPPTHFHLTPVVKRLAIVYCCGWLPLECTSALPRLHLTKGNDLSSIDTYGGRLVQHQCQGSSRRRSSRGHLHWHRRRDVHQQAAHVCSAFHAGTNNRCISFTVVVSSGE